MVTYPQYRDPSDKSTLKKQTICHKIDLTFLREQQDKNLGYVYKLNFNNYLKNSMSLRPVNESDEQAKASKILYNSYVGPGMKREYRFHCDVCFGNDVKMISEVVNTEEHAEK